MGETNLEGLCYHERAGVTSRPSMVDKQKKYWEYSCPECELFYGYCDSEEEAKRSLKAARPQPKTMTPAEVFDELEKRNISCVRLDYSGGNDSGGVQGVRITGKTGEDLDRELLSPRGYAHWQDPFIFKPYGGEARPMTQDDLDKIRLEVAMEAPCHNEYGSWAGEFEAYGTITWDVEARVAEMDDHYGETHYQNKNVTIYDGGQ